LTLIIQIEDNRQIRLITIILKDDLMMDKYDIYTYDITGDSLFIAFPVEYEYGEVIPLDDDYLMEIDVDGHPRAVEILNASTHFGVDKEHLLKICKLHMKITVTDETIVVEITLTILNEDMIPLIEAEKFKQHPML